MHTLVCHIVLRDPCPWAQTYMYQIMFHLTNMFIFKIDRVPHGHVLVSGVVLNCVRVCSCILCFLLVHIVYFVSYRLVLCQR